MTGIPKPVTLASRRSLCAAVALAAVPPASRAAAPSGGAEDDVARRARAVLARYVELLEAPGHPQTPIGGQQAFAILALNRSAADVQDANRRLAAGLAPFVAEHHWIDTPVNDPHLYWQQTTLMALLLDPALADRVTEGNRSAIKQLLFNFLLGFSDEYTRNRFGAADPAHAADIHGSDNHDIIRHGFFLLGSELLAQDAAFAARALPGGHTAATIAAAFARDTLLVLRRRAAIGLVAEIASPTYAGVYLQTLFLIADHASDPAVRQIAARYLDLTFADAAQETLAGVRGGARSRAYKTAAAYDAREDTFTLPLFVLTGEPAAGPLWPLRPGYMPPRDAFAMLTTAYRLPQPILDLFAQRAAMGSFQYDTRRPATGAQTQASVRGDPYPVYAPDAVSRYVRSSFVTPRYVLGWFTIDESRPALMVHDQNEEMGVITSVPDGRIAITGTPTNPDQRTSYSDLQAVGAGHAALIRHNIHAQARFPLRLFFSPDFVLREDSGWLFATAGDGHCWFALRAAIPAEGGVADRPVVASDWGRKVPGGPLAGTCKEIPVQATLAIDAGTSDEGSFAAFASRILAGPGLRLAAAEPGIAYRSPGGGPDLTLFTSPRVPEIDGRPVPLPPPLAYSSPFLRSQPDSSVVARTPAGASLRIDLA